MMLAGELVRMGVDERRPYFELNGKRFMERIGPTGSSGLPGA